MPSQILLTEAAAPATPGTDKITLYAKIGAILAFKNDAGVEVVLGAKDPETKSIIIENPTAAEDLSFFFTDVPITINKIRVILVGTTPSVTWTLRHGTSRSAAGAEVVTGSTVSTETGAGSDITSFDDATIVANSHVWFETSAVSGTINSIIINIFYTED